MITLQKKVSAIFFWFRSTSGSQDSDIAQRIVLEGNKKFIMIAGPSSSGKTSFSHRLSIQLLAHGMKPHRSELIIISRTEKRLHWMNMEKKIMNVLKQLM